MLGDFSLTAWRAFITHASSFPSGWGGSGPRASELELGLGRTLPTRKGGCFYFSLSCRAGMGAEQARNVYRAGSRIKIETVEWAQKRLKYSSLPSRSFQTLTLMCVHAHTHAESKTTVIPAMCKTCASHFSKNPPSHDIISSSCNSWDTMQVVCLSFVWTGEARGYGNGEIIPLICVKVGPKPPSVVATSSTFHFSKNSSSFLGPFSSPGPLPGLAC